MILRKTEATPARVAYSKKTKNFVSNNAANLEFSQRFLRISFKRMQLSFHRGSWGAC